MEKQIFSLIFDIDCTIKKNKVMQFIVNNTNCVNIKSDNHKRTPLMISSMLGLVDIVNCLLPFVENINDVDKFGNTALMLASSEGFLNVVSLLINNGAFINIQNKTGNTSLMLASHDLHTPVVKKLLADGADNTCKNNKGIGALELALKIVDDGEIIDLLSR